MREILFRGKDKYNGKWVEGFFTKGFRHPDAKGLENLIYIFSGEAGNFKFNYSVVEPETVGQYTGLKDKNGKKIFEGDIVEFSTTDYYGSKDYGVVVFREGCYGIEYVGFGGKTKSFHRIGQIEHWQDMGASGIITYKYQKIGNIHDNPELLGGANNG